MPASIWVVEDDKSICQLLRYNLEAEGFAVEMISDGEEASERLRESMPDLLILDWMLPQISGIEILRRLRERKETKSLPVIMLTARTEEDDIIRSFKIGADDYVTKPFSPLVLMARVKRHLGRVKPEMVSDVLTFGDITLNRVTHRVFRAEKPVQLSLKEFSILETLLRNPGQILSRERLLELNWKENLDIDQRTVDVHIGRLRKALSGNVDEGGQSSEGIIRCVKGVGYGLNDEYKTG